MPVFGNKSLSILQNAHPELRKVLNEAIKYFDFSVIESVRTQEQHEANMRAGKTKTTWEKSKHRARLDNEGRMTSWAVDVVPYPVDWQDKASFALMAGYILGIAAVLHRQGFLTHKLRWGGDWSMDGKTNDEKFYDGPHIEMIE